MRKPEDWTKVVGGVIPAAFWAGMAVIRADTQEQSAYWALTGLFMAFAIYYLVRPAAKPPA